MRKIVQILLAFCLIGTCIAIVGAVLRTSNIQAREELGVLIHRSGMGVMLLGFGGLFLLRKSKSGHRQKTAFSWTDVDGRLTVVPIVRNEILNLSVRDRDQERMTSLEDCDLDGVRCLIARGRTIDKKFVSRLVKLQQLRVMDLQNTTLGDGVIQELELLESLEVLLLAGCLEPSQTKELRITLPEVRIIFDPR